MINQLLDFANAVFGDREIAQLWLRTSNPSLGNERPLDLVYNESGRNMIKTLLGQIQHGIY